MLFIWAVRILKDEDTCHDQAQMNSTLSMLLICVDVLCNTAFGKAKRVSCCPLLKVCPGVNPVGRCDHIQDCLLLYYNSVVVVVMFHSV